MRAIRKGLQGAGIPVENSKGEWGPGQEEINVRYADALDHGRPPRHPQERLQGNRLRLQGKAVTFMAKWRLRPRRLLEPYPQPRCGTPPARRRCSSMPRPSTACRRLMRHYVAGQLAYAREITYFLAPYINSYKRFQVGTFAPTKAIWTLDNRTAGFRLCGESSKAIRIECRIGGADLNPYLAFAALIAAGLAGIEEKLELEAPLRRRRLLRQEAARDAEDAARGDRALTKVEDAARGASATRSSTTMSTPPNGSSSNMTAASPTGN